MASRNPRKRQRQRARMIILAAIALISSGVIAWMMRPPPKVERHVAPVTAHLSDDDLKENLAECRQRLALAPARTLPTSLASYFNAVDALAGRTGSPNLQQRLAETIAIHQAAYGVVDVRERLATLSAQALAQNAGDSLALEWQFRAVLAQSDPKAAPSPALQSAWQQAIAAGNHNSDLYHAYCSHLLKGDAESKNLALTTAESAAAAGNDYGNRLLLLEVQLAAAAADARSPVERRILAFQRNPPTDLPDSQLIRLSRLSAAADPLPVADREHTLAAGILRGNRLLEAARNRRPTTALLRAAITQHLWAGQYQDALKLCDKLAAPSAAPTAAATDVVASAANKRFAAFAAAFAHLHQIRLNTAPKEQERIRQSFNAAYNDLAERALDEDWDAQLLQGASLILIGETDRGTALLEALKRTSDWQSAIQSWLTLGAWNAGRPRDVIRLAEGLSTDATVPVALRREAVELAIRSRLLLREVELAQALVPSLEGLVQSDAPLDHANLLIQLVRTTTRAADSNPLSVVSALQRLRGSRHHRTTAILDAAFAMSQTQADLARARAADLIDRNPHDLVARLFQLSLHDANGSFAKRVCQESFVMIPDEAIRKNLQERLNRPTADTAAITNRLLAAVAPLPAERRRILAEAAFAEGDYQTARENAVSSNLRFFIDVEDGNLAAARAHLATLAPTSPDRQPQTAALFLAEGNPRAALDILSDSSQTATVETRRLRARAFAQLNQVAPALAELESAARLDPRDPLACRDLIQLHLRRNAAAAARNAYAERQRQTLPKWLIPLLADRLDAPAPALAIYRLSVQCANDTVPDPAKEASVSLANLRQAAELLLATGRRAEAESLLARFARVPDPSPWESRQIARAAAAVPIPDLAHKAYATATSPAPAPPQIAAEWLRWSAEYAPSARPFDALGDALLDMPADTRCAAAQLALALNDPAHATRLLAGLPQTPDAEALRAQTALAAGSPADADAPIARALAGAPDHPLAHMLRARRLDKWNEVRLEIEAALAQRPLSPSLHLMAAAIAADHNRDRDGAAFAESARALAPHSPHVLTAVGRVYLRLRQLDKLKALLETSGSELESAAELRFQLAYDYDDAETIRALLPQVSQSLKTNPQLSARMIRAALEYQLPRTASSAAEVVAALPKRSPEQNAAVWMVQAPTDPQARQSLLGLQHHARWIALAVASLPGATEAARQSALGAALADRTRWNFPDLRAAVRVAEIHPSPSLAPLFHRYAADPGVPQRLRAQLARAEGRLLLRQGEYTQAASVLRDSLRLVAETETTIVYAQALAADGQHKKAREALLPLQRHKIAAVDQLLQLIDLQAQLASRLQNQISKIANAGGIEAAADALIALPAWSNDDLMLAASLVANPQTTLNTVLLLAERMESEAPNLRVNRSELASAFATAAARRQDFVTARKHLKTLIDYDETPQAHLRMAAVCDKIGWSKEAAEHRQKAAALVMAAQ